MTRIGSLAVFTLSILGACSKDAPAEPAAAAAAPAAPAAAAAPTAKVAVDIDPDVVAEVKKVTTCTWKDHAVDDDCGWAAQFDSYARKYAILTKEGEDVPDDDKEKKLEASCLTLIGDADPRVRYAALICLGHGDQLSGDKAALDLVFARVDVEPEAPLRDSAVDALVKLQPFKAGMSDRVVPVIKKLRADATAGNAIGELLLSAAPVDDSLDVTPATFDLAADIAKNGPNDARENAMGLLAMSKARATEACAALGAIAASGKEKWSYAAEKMAAIGAPCKPQLDAVTATAVAMMKQSETPGGDIGYLDHVKNFGYSAPLGKERRAKLVAAARTLAAKSKDSLTKEFALDAATTIESQKAD
jgi:hypothetical protein